MRAEVVGVTFCDEDLGVNRQDVIASLSGNEKVYLRREPQNRFDKNAVAVMLKRKDKDFKVGYIRSELAAFLAGFWPKYKFFAKIIEIRAGDVDQGVPYGISIDIVHSLRKNMPRKKDQYTANKEEKIFI